MSFCPNCGAPIKEGSKFCQSCGATVQAVQPVETHQPVTPAAPAAPVTPVAHVQPVQPEAPVTPAVQQPVQQVQPSLPVMSAQPAYQTRSTATPAKKTNGLCIAGFILALCSIVTFGVTSFVGLVLSIIGTVFAFVKNQKGKVLGIIGIALSLIFMLLSISLYKFIANNNKEIDDNPSRTQKTEQTETTGKPAKKDPAGKTIISTCWVEIDSGRTLYFGTNSEYRFFDSFDDRKNNYSTGVYNICLGEGAIDKLKTDYADEGMDEEDISYWIECDPSCERQNFVLLVLTPNEIWTDGVKAEGEGAVAIYAGFLCESSEYEYELKLEIFPTMAEYKFIPEEVYLNDFEANETSSTSEESFSSDVDLMGDSVTGTVALYQGSWADWHEADGLDDFYESRAQMINTGSGTIINLSVFPEQYNADAPQFYADLSRQSMEQGGCTDITMEETAIGGYAAYTVTGLYPDGMYLTIWYFVDDNSKLHYISVEYIADDLVSYEMVRDTYSFN